MVALPLVLPPSVLGFYLLISLGPQGWGGQFTQWLGIGLLRTRHAELTLGAGAARSRQRLFMDGALSNLANPKIAVFYFARNFARRATLAVFGIVSKKLAEKLADTASKLADGLHFLGRGRDAGPFLLETGLYWLVNACGMWVLAWGCGIVHEGGSPITLGECFALMGMLGAAILIPGPPGMLGVFQVGIFCGMTLYFPEDIVKSNGAVFTFLLYVIQFAWTILAAVGCLFDREALASLKSSEDSAAVSVEAT